MKIAIIGAGLAGLATAYNLSLCRATVDVFGFDKGASFASTGLLHPYPGKFCRKSWEADSAIIESQKLLSLVEQKSNRKVFHDKGILRPAMFDFQKKAFQKAAKKDADLTYLNNCSNYHPMFDFEGLFIRRGGTVFSSLYLQCLKECCIENNVRFIQEKIQDLEELKDYDQIVLANGAKIDELQKDIPIEKVLGRALVCRWPEDIPKLPMSIASMGHISITDKDDICMLGSTYEREPLSEKEVIFFLREKIGNFFPIAKDFEVLDITSGTRACRIGGSIPIACRINNKVWLFSALGSRGLIYHGYLAKMLSKAIMEQNEILLPKELRV